MKTLPLVLATLFVLSTCSKPPKDKKEQDQVKSVAQKRAAKKTVELMSHSPALLQFHYRFTPGLKSVKAALQKELGFIVEILWSQFKAFEQLDLWILPPEGKDTPDFEKMQIAACVTGGGKNYIYLMLKDEKGAPLSTKVDTYVTWTSDRVQGPREYILYDNGKKLCMGSTRALLDKARQWKVPPSQDPDHFINAHLNLPILFSPKVLGSQADLLEEKVLSLDDRQRSNIRRLVSLVKSLRLLSVGMGIDKDLNLKLSVPMYLKKTATFPEGFATKSGDGVPPDAKGEILAFSFDLHRGKLLGMDILPPVSPSGDTENQASIRKAFPLITHVDLSLLLHAKGLSFPRFRIVTSDGKTVSEALVRLKKALEKKRTVPVNIASSKPGHYTLIWDFKPPLDEAQKSHARAFGAQGRWEITQEQDTFFLNWNTRSGRANKSAVAPLSRLSMYLFGLAKFGGQINKETAMDALFAKADITDEKPVILSLDSQPTVKQILFHLSLPVGSWIKLLQKNPEISVQLKKRWEDKLKPAPSDL
ncbi:hypothetical protein KKF84_10535 [Myxococcota bacterium]|nr:hypothetical protein [Myxococcota bacterium]